MERRQKDLYTMAEQAGLSPKRYERKSNRGTLLCLAENGAERVFSISLGTRGDVRGDLNELGAMKRFARENAMPAPTTTESTTNDTNAMPKNPAQAQLDPVAFYRACEWLKGQKMSSFASLEALALQAAQHAGTATSEADMKLVMETLKVQEPAHWHEPKDPQAILVRELATVMKKLGETPSPAFDRLAARLLA